MKHTIIILVMLSIPVFSAEKVYTDPFDIMEHRDVAVGKTAKIKAIFGEISDGIITLHAKKIVLSLNCSSIDEKELDRIRLKYNQWDWVVATFEINGTVLTDEIRIIEGKLIKLK
jgi:hypothetical protein